MGKSRKKKTVSGSAMVAGKVASTPKKKRLATCDDEGRKGRAERDVEGMERDGERIIGSALGRAGFYYEEERMEREESRAHVAGARRTRRKQHKGGKGARRGMSRGWRGMGKG